MGIGMITHAQIHLCMCKWAVQDVTMTAVSAAHMALLLTEATSSSSPKLKFY